MPIGAIIPEWHDLLVPLVKFKTTRRPIGTKRGRSVLQRLFIYTMPTNFLEQFKKNLEDCGFAIRSQIIWVKSHFEIGRGDYHHKHEPCWYAEKKENRGNWESDKKQTTVWKIDKPMKSET